MAVSTTGNVFSGSFKLYVRNIPLLLLFAMFFALLYTLLVTHISRSVDKNITLVTANPGFSQQQYKELLWRIDDGDEAAHVTLLQAMNMASGEYERMTQQQKEAYVEMRTQEVSQHLSPYFLIFGLFCLLLFLLSSLVGIVILVQSPLRITDILRKCAEALLPMALTWGWLFLRSFFWLFLAGLLPGLREYFLLLLLAGVVVFIFYGIRLLFAPVLLIQDHLAPRAAVDRSLQINSGHWRALFHSLLLLVIGMGMLYAVLRRALATLVGFSQIASLFLSGLLHQLIFFFCMAFLITLLSELRRTPVEHPSL